MYSCTVLHHCFTNRTPEPKYETTSVWFRISSVTQYIQTVVQVVTLRKYTKQAQRNTSLSTRVYGPGWCVYRGEH